MDRTPGELRKYLVFGSSYASIVLAKNAMSIAVVSVCMTVYWAVDQFSAPIPLGHANDWLACYVAPIFFVVAGANFVFLHQRTFSLHVETFVVRRQLVHGAVTLLAYLPCALSSTALTSPLVDLALIVLAVITWYWTAAMYVPCRIGACLTDLDGNTTSSK